MSDEVVANVVTEEVVVDRLAGTTLGKLRDLVASLETDYLKGMSGVKTAARRVRGAVQELTPLRMAVRKELLAAMKASKEED